MDTVTRTGVVEERLRSLSQNEAIDRWPSLAETVSAHIPETDREQYECWTRIGGAAVMRHIRVDTIPRPIFGMLPPAAALHTRVVVYFTAKQPLGQEDDLTRRNLIAAFGPLWDQASGGQTLAWPGMWAEIGCVHDYETIAERNCYRKARCRRCGHQWARDSGD